MNTMRPVDVCLRIVSMTGDVSGSANAGLGIEYYPGELSWEATDGSRTWRGISSNVEWAKLDCLRDVPGGRIHCVGLPTTGGGYERHVEP